MEAAVFTDLDMGIARVRILLSLAVLLSMYVDPTIGGLFHLGTRQLATLILYLVYAIGAYSAVWLDLVPRRLLWISSGLDLLVASLLTLCAEGPTSPSFAVFLFAIIAAGSWARLRTILTVTLLSASAYLLAIILSTHGLTNAYLMRAVYLGIAGYLITFLGQLRDRFEARLHELETIAERQNIARSLHDGYIQALGGIALRLESCRDMLRSNEATEAITELSELQNEVSREYDEVRAYVRSLVGADASVPANTFAGPNTRFRIQAAFSASGLVVEHVLQIMLEGMRNTRRHGQARFATIEVHEIADAVRVVVEDDGVGFGEPKALPWTIASRVSEFGGRLKIGEDKGVGARLEIEMPKV